jgi:hypothetical protein
MFFYAYLCIGLLSFEHFDSPEWTTLFRDLLIGFGYRRDDLEMIAFIIEFFFFLFFGPIYAFVHSYRVFLQNKEE